jgi:hypothetical protein
MTEAPSVTTFIVGDRLPWPDEASLDDEKGPFDPGVILDARDRRECSIRKISAKGITLRSDAEKVPGDQVAIELGTGQRVGTLDMVALLNRKLVSQPVERRTMPRVEIRCEVFVKFGENFCSATMRNISGGGLQIEGDELPPCGTYVSVFVEGLNVPPGEVVWRRSNLAGIEVIDELSWTSIIPWIKAQVNKVSSDSG